MTRDNEPAIEVEVVEIDGAAPPPKPVAGAMRDPDGDDESGGRQKWTNWQGWPGQVRTLHPLWWPLLIVAGGAVLALVLTIGVLAMLLLLAYRIVRGVLRALFE
ncbi:MAG: hypothetical protein WCK77_09345 [Verrucomicrobiota bacterium]